MEHSLFRKLLQSAAEGTLSPGDEAALTELLRIRAVDIYEICPACGGAFSMSLKFQLPLHCPQCSTPLETWSSDLAGHHADEIDPEVPQVQWLGEYTSGYSFPGVVPCQRCGLLYPQRYSCCPNLFNEAATYWECGGERERQAVREFINIHRETLLNVLRSRFRDGISAGHLRVLEQLAVATEY